MERPAPAVSAPASDQQQSNAEDDPYFQSYGDLHVHELMIRDEPRTRAYAEFFEKHGESVRGKVVLDVGAGTGILAMFAARAGARKVYAVEASGAAHAARLLVAHNGLSERVEVLHTRVEDLSALPGGEKADVLVSEWMGFYLLHEGMLEAVLSARDRLLRPGGLLVPSRARLLMAPVSLQAERAAAAAGWAAPVFGLDLSPLAGLLQRQALARPLVTLLQPDQLLAPPALLAELDLAQIDPSALACVFARLQFPAAPRAQAVDGLGCWFEVDFEGAAGAAGPPLRLSTGPHAPPTHWKQTVLALPASAQLQAGDVLAAFVTLAADPENPRHYNLFVELDDGAAALETDADADEDADEDGHGANCACDRCRLIRALAGDETDMQQRLAGALFDK